MFHFVRISPVFIGVLRTSKDLTAVDTKYDKNSSKFNPALLHKNVIGRLAKSIKFDNLTNVIYCAL
jgi:hypothetical protein